MSKSKLDIFAAIAGRLRNAFKINGQSTDGTQDVVIDKLGLISPVNYLPQSIISNNLLLENGYLAFRTLGSNIDPARFTTPGEYVSCTCLISDNTLTLSMILETTGDMFIYTASSVSTEWTLKSTVGRSDGSVAEAETLSTPRLINGVGFDGSKDISTSNWGPSVNFTLSGDVVGSVTGQRGTTPVTINATLNNSGVVAGSYSKVTVDAKGRVIGNTSLLPIDIPSLSADKITVGTFHIDRLPTIPSTKIDTIPSTKIDTIYLNSSHDLNNILTPGLYNWSSPPANIPPGSTYSHLEVTTWGDGAHQIVKNSSGYIWFRNKQNAGTAWTVWYEVYSGLSLSASKITSGVFAADRIPSLDTSKITSGVLADARIPALNASKVTSGAFALDRLPQIPVSKVSGAAVSGSRITGMCTGEARPVYNTAAIEAGAPNVAATFPTYSFHKFGVYASTLSAISAHEFAFYRQDGVTLAHVEAYLNGSLVNRGQVPAAHIANLDASKITSGVLAEARIPAIPLSKVSGSGNLASRTIYISTAEPNNATGVEGDLWGVIQ